MNVTNITAAGSDDLLRDAYLSDIVLALNEALDEAARSYAADRCQDADDFTFEVEVDRAREKLSKRLYRLLKKAHKNRVYHLEERHVEAFAGIRVKAE